MNGGAAAGGEHGRGERQAEADAAAVAHLGREAEAQAQAQRAAAAGEGAAPETAGIVGAASGTRDLAGLAPRVELAIAPVLLADRAGVLARARSVRVPHRALLG